MIKSNSVTIYEISFPADADMTKICHYRFATTWVVTSINVVS